MPDLDCVVMEATRTRHCPLIVRIVDSSICSITAVYTVMREYSTIPRRIRSAGPACFETKCIIAYTIVDVIMNPAEFSELGFLITSKLQHSNSITIRFSTRLIAAK